MVSTVKIGYSTEKAEELKALSDCDIVVAANGVFKPINYKNELLGKSASLVELGKLSIELGALLLVGAETDNYGLLRQSVVASEKGRLLGISDATRVFERQDTAASGFKIYNTKNCKVGILVERDICCYNAVKTLADCECDVVVAIMTSLNDFRAETLASSLSYLFGIALCFVSGKQVIATSPKGELIHNTEKGSGYFNLTTARNYHEITVKSRGV